jgi:hypothetical protein
MVVYFSRHPDGTIRARLLRREYACTSYGLSLVAPSAYWVVTSSPETTCDTLHLSPAVVRGSFRFCDPFMWPVLRPDFQHLWDASLLLVSGLSSRRGEHTRVRTYDSIDNEHMDSIYKVKFFLIPSATLWCQHFVVFDFLSSLRIVSY